MPENRLFDFEVFAPEERPNCCSEAAPGSCSACERLVAAEQRVRDATNALEKVLAERQQLRKHGNSVHDPFNRLPTEVSSHIFSFCVSPLPTLDEFYEDYHWHHEPEELYTQITLGAVCQGWRRVAWATPSLWNFLSLVITHRTPPSCGIFVRQWLERSQPLPLTIRFAYRSDMLEGGDPSMLDPIINPLVDVLNESINRWSMVYLHIPNSYTSRLRCDPTQPPAIKALTLWSLADIHPPHEFRSFGQVQDAIFNLGCLPSPTHLRIDGYHVPTLHIQWGEITRFDGRNLTVEEGIAVFRLLTGVTRCEMFVHLPDRPVIRPIIPITLQHLTVLDLSDPVKPILDQLSCPALRKIVWSIDDLQLFGPATEFIMRSKCVLEEARFRGFRHHDEDDLIEFLNCSPSLTTLSFERPIQRALIDLIGLTAYQRNDPFLPNLQTFMYFGKRNFPWSSIPAMIPPPPPPPSATDKAPRPLIRLEFCFDYSGYRESDDEDTTSEELVLRDKIKQEDVVKILDLVDAGISVSIEAQDETQIIDLWACHYGLYEDDEGTVESDADASDKSW